MMCDDLALTQRRCNAGQGVNRGEVTGAFQSALPRPPGMCYTPPLPPGCCAGAPGPAPNGQCRAGNTCVQHPRVGPPACSLEHKASVEAQSVPTGQSRWAVPVGHVSQWDTEMVQHWVTCLRSRAEASLHAVFLAPTMQPARGAEAAPTSSHGRAHPHLGLLCRAHPLAMAHACTRVCIAAPPACAGKRKHGARCPATPTSSHGRAHPHLELLCRAHQLAQPRAHGHQQVHLLLGQDGPAQRLAPLVCLWPCAHGVRAWGAYMGWCTQARGALSDGYRGSAEGPLMCRWMSSFSFHFLLSGAWSRAGQVPH